VRKLAVILAFAGLAVWPGVPAAHDTLSAGLIQSTEVTAQRHGVDLLFAVRRVDGGVPPSLTRLVVEFPPRTALHARRFPRCGLARLQAKGPAGCPPRARVGSDAIVAQSPIEPKRVEETLTEFNGVPPNGRPRRVLLLHVRPEVGPRFVLVAAWKGSAHGLRLDLAWPPPIRVLAGVPPDPAPTRMSLVLDARRGSTSYVTSGCDRVYKATSYFRDGSSLTSSAHSSCD